MDGRGDQPAKNFWKSILHPDDRDQVLAEEARCEQTGEPFDMEYRAFTKSGEVLWVRDRCVLVRDEDGRPLYWQGVTVDITDISGPWSASRRRPGGCAPSTR